MEAETQAHIDKHIYRHIEGHTHNMSDSSSNFKLKETNKHKHGISSDFSPRGPGIGQSSEARLFYGSEDPVCPAEIKVTHNATCAKGASPCLVHVDVKNLPGEGKVQNLTEVSSLTATRE